MKETGLIHTVDLLFNKEGSHKNTAKQYEKEKVTIFYVKPK